MEIKRAVFVLLLAPALLANSSAQAGTAKQTQPPMSATGQGTAQQAPTPVPDPLSEMRDDLSRLESLNSVMSSEIEFLRDQNLQILLRTNSQMWTVVIRDLRRQLDSEEQRRGMQPQKE